MKCPICQCDSIKVRTHNIENTEPLAVMEDSEVYDIVSMYQCQQKHVFYVNDGNDNSTDNLPLVSY